MRILITGGAGFIGSALAHRMVDEGHDVVVFDRFSRGKEHRVPDEAEVVKGDIRDRVVVDRVVGDFGPHTIWHLAYVQGTQTFYADPYDVISVALRGIMNVLDAAATRYHGDTKQHPELILVSSSEVYQTPPEGMFPTDETVPLSVPDVTNPRYSYGAGKIASEVAALAYAQAGLLKRAVIVRPHNVYGPDMGYEHVIPEFAVRMMELQGRDFPIQGTGRETRSFCYIDDCIDGLMLLHERGENRQVYHLGNPAEEHSIEELAYEMARQMRKEPIDIVPGQLPKGSPTRRLPDTSKLAALGFEPKVDLTQGLRPTLAWYEGARVAAA